MATIPTPHSFTAGEYATATNLDSYYTGLQFLLGVSGSNPHPYCYAYQTTAQTLAAGTATSINLDTEVEDSDNIHVTTAGSNSFFTIVTPGVYHAIAEVTFPSTASGQDFVVITHNGSGACKSLVSAIATAHPLQVQAYIRCVASDTIGLTAQSTSGGALTAGQINTWMQARWVRE
jgi:hypothetical protein